MLSIIIPTLNEEKYLPKLLESIKKQDFTRYEIIVADADSIDKTKHVRFYLSWVVISIFLGLILGTIAKAYGV